LHAPAPAARNCALLSDEDREELAADGVPAPKPIALTRQSPDGIPR
jgi:hypothetical protein